jgi:hypothetical protein
VDEDLRQELLRRRDEDQRVRSLVSPPSGQHIVSLPDEVAAEWHRVDEDNTRWLGDLLTTHGWPGRTVVGEDGALAAFLLAQHADRAPDLQRFCKRCAERSLRAKAPLHTWPTLRTGCESVPGSRSCMARSSLSLAARLSPIRSRTPRDLTSAVQRRGSNRSLTTRPG